MNILITGGCGFIGSNFIRKQILSTDNKIANIDSLTYAGNEENLSNISGNPRYSYYKGNIIDAEFVNDVFLEFRPDVLVHFAAESHVDRSISSPLRFVETNVLGTSTLLNSSLNYWKSILKQDLNTFKFIHISTDEVFGSLGKTGFFNEDSPYSPNSPYSASKAASDFLVKAWNKTYNLPVIITNCSNNYGPYQFPEKIIPLMITNCIQEKFLPIYGDGLNVRDWIYVDDHCDAITNIIDSGTIGDTYSIGGNNEICNLDLVKYICKSLDKLKPRKNGEKYSKLIRFVEDRAGHDFRYAIDSSKINNELKWQPKESFKSGILKTVKWYLKNESWWIKLKDLDIIK